MIPINRRPDLKTPEEHLQFLSDFAKVKLFYGFYRYASGLTMNNETSGSLENVISSSTFLINLTDLHTASIFDTPCCSDTPRWQTIIQEIEDHGKTTLPDSREKPDLLQWAYSVASDGVLVLDREDLFASRVQRDIDDLHQGKILGNYTESIFNAHTIIPFQNRDYQNMEGLEFHIANASYPRSFFEDPKLIQHSFKKLISTARKNRAHSLVTTTWLNSLPKWLELFPSCWRNNLGPADSTMGPHLGCWGQFISSRQALNRRTAATLYETGKNPYPMRQSWCSVEDLADYWEKNNRME